MPRPRCTTCDGVGSVIEYRLIWTRVEPGKEPVDCSRRVLSIEDGYERMKALGPGEVEADVVSCARVCDCRKNAVRRAAAGPEKGAAAPAFVASPPVEPFDWKMAQAGDR